MSYVPSTIMFEDDHSKSKKFIPMSRKWFIEKGSPRNEIGLGYDNPNKSYAMKDDDMFEVGM